MKKLLRRTVRLLRVTPVAAIVLAGAGPAPAGPGSPPPRVPGQLVYAYFPHATQVFPTVAARDSAGRIVAAARFSRGAGGLARPAGIAVGRFTAAGRPDPSFGTLGGTVSDAPGAIPSDQQTPDPQAVSPLPDGGLLVSGFFVDHLFLERFAADGTLDRSFGTNGIVNGAVTHSLEQRTLALTPLADGTIVFVHSVPQPQGASSKDTFAGGLLIDRLSPNGAELSQTTYGPPAWTVGTTASYPFWAAAHVFPDGSVLAAGSMEVPIAPPCPCEFHPEFLLERFHSDGMLDASFGAGGRVATRIGTGSTAQSLAVGGDGTIVIGGTTDGGGVDHVVAARYGPDGTLDPSFGQGGTEVLDQGEASAMAVAADGRVFLSTNETTDLTVLALERSGALIAQFGANGRATDRGAGRVVALLPDAQGGVTALVGHVDENDFKLVRYTAAGEVDSAFGGRPLLVGLPPSEGALALATTSGRIAVAGFAEDETGRTGLHVALIDHGIPAKMFGTDGESTVLVGDRARATAVGFDAARGIVVGGDSTTSRSTRWVVARFQEDGTLDPAFGAGGIVRSPVTGDGDGVRGLSVLPDSRVLVLVREGGRAVLLRLSADGSPDRGFGDAGRVTLPFADAAALTTLPDGGAVVAGEGLACVFVDGRGVATTRTDAALPTAAVSVGVARQRDGALLVAATTPAGLAVARRLPDGTLDSSFGNRGVASFDGAAAVGLAVQRDGRIDVAVRPSGASRFGVVRFLETGQVDSSFGANGLATAMDGGVVSALATPGGILVAGTAPSPRGTDFGVAVLDDVSLVSPVVGTLFHVTPKGAVRRVAIRATQPDWSQAAGLLAYVADDDGAPAIVARRNGTSRLLGGSPLPGGADIAVAEPRWSRDGTLLAVPAFDAAGNSAIAVLGAAGGRPRRLVAALRARWTSRRELAFAAPDDTIRILDVDTGRMRSVGGGTDVVPSPRGRVLAVARGAWLLVGPEGAVVARLPTRFYDPQWAPDGRHLSGFDRGQLVVVDLHGRERRLAVPSGEEARAPVWSLDGRMIAFVNRAGGRYSIDFVDVASGRRVGRWSPGPGFGYADPTWDATGVYIPTV